MICKNCGKENAEDAKFCGKCGKPLTEAVNVPDTSVSQTSSKRNTGKIIIAVVGVLAVVLIGAVIKNAGKKPAETVTPEAPATEAIPETEPAPALYQPSENEHRFEDILKEVNEKQEITIVQGDNDLVSYAYSESAKQYVYFYTSYLMMDDEDLEGIGSYVILLLEEKPNVAVFRWIDPEQKIMSYYAMVGDLDLVSRYRDTSNWFTINEHMYVDPEAGWGFEVIAKIPEILSPEHWNYVSADTIAIDGTEYYCETYQVNYTGYDEEDVVRDQGAPHYKEGSGYPMECTINVAIDRNGDVAYIGEAEKDDSPSIENPKYTENTMTLMHLFDDKIHDANHISYLCGNTSGQYMKFSVKPEFDREKYNIETYQMIPSVIDYNKQLNVSVKNAILEELGLGLDF